MKENDLYENIRKTLRKELVIDKVTETPDLFLFCSRKPANAFELDHTLTLVFNGAKEQPDCQPGVKRIWNCMERTKQCVPCPDREQSPDNDEEKNAGDNTCEFCCSFHYAKAPV